MGSDCQKLSARGEERTSGLLLGMLVKPVQFLKSRHSPLPPGTPTGRLTQPQLSCVNGILLLAEGSEGCPLLLAGQLRSFQEPQS